MPNYKGRQCALACARRSPHHQRMLRANLEGCGDGSALPLVERRRQCLHRCVRRGSCCSCLRRVAIRKRRTHLDDPLHLGCIKSSVHGELLEAMRMELNVERPEGACQCLRCRNQEGAGGPTRLHCGSVHASLTATNMEHHSPQQPFLLYWSGRLVAEFCDIEREKPITGGTWDGINSQAPLLQLEHDAHLLYPKAFMQLRHMPLPISKIRPQGM
mmetsp:Transcript_122802/g.274270  ORF Transcript_122802/g.274270 Transcript_122802/m.274270 type:complete len:215 (-) Transcript_122802:473-1117(-)